MRVGMLLLAAIAMWGGLTSAMKVFWNVPTGECSPEIQFDLAKFGITQNTGDTFRGDKFNILYRPGLFPHVIGNNVGALDITELRDVEVVNGGIPQRGSLKKHLNRLRIDIERFIQKDYRGPAVIDFEEWQTTLRSTGKIMYRGFSRRYFEFMANMSRTAAAPGHANSFYNYTAEELFERAARPFLEETLKLARRLRPNALWGYYHYPYCKAYLPHVTRCARAISDDNDRAQWIYANSVALYPSVYFKKYNYTSWEKCLETQSRLAEADRMANKVGGRPIYPYTWFAYHERHDLFLSRADLLASIGQVASRQPEGFIIWGGSESVNDTRSCLRLRQYVETRLGPFIDYLRRLTSAELKDLNFRITSSRESFYTQLELLTRQSAFGGLPFDGPTDADDTEEEKRSQRDLLDLELMLLNQDERPKPNQE